MGVFNFAVWCVVLVGLMALFVYDMRWLILPDRITYPLIGLAVVAAFANITVFGSGLIGLRDTATSVLIASGLFYGLFQASKGKWIGGGDVKLGLVIGLVLAAPLQAFLVLFFASLIGTVTILPGLATKKLKATTHIPFGPFLIIATVIVRLFGASIVAWYRRKFLLY
jgi:prepilin signal peptidase PulO-like enzyme (type II secretory pathway)